MEIGLLLFPQTTQLDLDDDPAPPFKSGALP